MKALYELAGSRHELVPLRRAQGLDLVIDGRRRSVELRELGPGERLLTIGGKPYRAFIARRGDSFHIHLEGRSFEVKRVSERAGAGAGGHAADTVTAPMPGTVIRTEVAAGDNVKRGDLLLAIESMKLETAIRAPRDGVIARVAVASGGTFDKGALLVALRPLEAAEG